MTGRSRLSALPKDLGRERVQAHEDREEMRSLYDRQLSDVRAALIAEQERTARLEAQHEELRRAGRGQDRRVAGADDEL
jgi:hypothetical protein